MRKWENRNLCASQTRPYEDLRLKTKFGLVNVISHIWKKEKQGKEYVGTFRLREEERDL